MDFLLPEGPQGANGLSAYEVWVEAVKGGQIDWPADETTLQDFFLYLKGTEGANGLSAYELWKQAVLDGLIIDPQTNKSWDTTRTSEADFYAYMAGGRGDSGLSAYEIWKQDLAERAGTDNPIIDPKTGYPWPANKNTLDDFYEFLRGADGEDGKDGQDGKPGEVGKPGTEVVIIEGVPNVIAQFSQSEFGEYVRTTDGGVLYVVYDEEGVPAPGAIVSGLPGIENKTYTADEDGSFIVPREDLPSVQDINSRWGTTRSVTIKGKSPVQSARNTYVPNKVDLRISVTRTGYLYNNYFYVYYNVERRLNPEDEWIPLATYLPNASGLKIALPETTGKNSLTTTSSNVLVSLNSSSESSGYFSYSVSIKYKIKSNMLNQKNGYDTYATGDTYFTMKGSKEYYGVTPAWNGTCLLPIGQMGPIVKSIALKTFRSGTDPSFASLTGIFSFDHMDMSKILKGVKLSEQSNGMQFIEPEYYDIETAKARKDNYVSLSYSSSSGSQRTDSSNSKSSYDSPSFTVLSPFLNSTISTDCGDGLLEYTVGKLEQNGTSTTSFKVTPSISSHPSISVTYSN